MWSSLARRALRGVLLPLSGLGLAAVLLSACVGPVPAAKHALQSWLDDVGAHSVAYAYTLLSTQAAARTDYDVFFDYVNASDANYAIVSTREVSAEDVEAVVRVTPRSGGRVTLVKLQMVEEGNAGDWLVNAPFTSEGARAMRAFQ